MSAIDSGAVTPLSIARRVEMWDRALQLVRAALRSAGLREVSTAILADTPVIEVGVQPILSPPGWLATSSAQAMKRLLCLGSGPIFQISHAFRRGDDSPRDHEEFHLVEWVRTTDVAADILQDVETLVGCCYEAAGQAAPSRWLRVGLLDLIEETLGVVLRGDEDAEALRRMLAVLGSPALEELLSRAPSGPAGAALTLGTWNAFVETWSDRHLVPWFQTRAGVGVHLCDYPAVLCAMAATGETGWVYTSRAGRKQTHRFESFVGGVACAHGHRALCDADEQLHRMTVANQLRELTGRLPLPMDRAFVGVLRAPGLPACAGGTLALDRALMLACGAHDVRHASPLLEPGAPAGSADTEGQHHRRRGLSDVAALVRLGLARDEQMQSLEEVERRFAVGISRTMLERLEDADDPLGRQFVPDVRELRIAPEERPDPIGDDVHQKTTGLIHRYRDRALLKPTHLCAVYCRFCFRRSVLGDPTVLSAEVLEAALEGIRARPEIWEVILTGGDPLVLAPQRLATLMQGLREIPHVRVIRIHTRVPLVAPERVTPALLRALRGTKPVYVVLHANHVEEFSPSGAAACAALVDAGIPMLSQTVLLKGVNDSPEALEALLRRLVEHRVKPYYLHHPDLVEGTSHLRVSLHEGRRLVRSLRGGISGICQPVYVLDIPGGFGKVPAAEAWVSGPEPNGSFQVTDPGGAVHIYREPLGEDA